MGVHPYRSTARSERAAESAPPQESHGECALGGIVLVVGTIGVVTGILWGRPTELSLGAALVALTAKTWFDAHGRRAG